MNGYELSRQFFDFSFEHHECGVYHTAIYMLAIEQNNRYGWKKEFGFPTAYNCDVLGIGNRNTYLSALKDLVDWGFIEIICESKNQFKATVISLCHIKIDIATDTAGYTALDKALIGQDICHGYAIDTIDKQVNNETKKQVNNETSIVPTETKIIKNEYQENISYMRQQADSIRNEILPDIPNFVKQGQEEEWGKFILYWTSPTSKGTIACEEALNGKIKSFDIKRRFSFWLSNKDKQVTNSSYQPKKTTVGVLDK